MITFPLFRFKIHSCWDNEPSISANINFANYENLGAEKNSSWKPSILISTNEDITIVSCGGGGCILCHETISQVKYDCEYEKYEPKWLFIGKPFRNPPASCPIDGKENFFSHCLLYNREIHFIVIISAVSAKDLHDFIENEARNLTMSFFFIPEKVMWKIEKRYDWKNKALEKSHASVNNWIINSVIPKFLGNHSSMRQMEKSRDLKEERLWLINSLTEVGRNWGRLMNYQKNSIYWKWFSYIDHIREYERFITQFFE